MAFDPNIEDVVEIEDQPQEGSCHFRGKIHFSKGYHQLFTSKFHQDRSTLHIIASLLEKHPDGAYFRQHITLNGVRLILFEREKKVYLFLETELSE